MENSKKKINQPLNEEKQQLERLHSLADKLNEKQIAEAITYLASLIGK